MSNAPFSSQHLVRFRDTTSSSAQNKFMQDVLFDLTELYNLANAQEKKIEDMERFAEISSYYSQNLIDEMKYELISLRDDLLAIQSPGKTYLKRLYTYDIKLDPISEEYEKALVDEQHRVVTLPYLTNPTSKIYLYDEVNDEYILPNTIKYEIFPEADGVGIIENDFKNALTPIEYDLWHREYRFLSGIKTHVDTTIVIDLPDNIITNRDVNTITIHPFPYGKLDIIGLEYRLDKSWIPLNVFNKMDNIGNVKFCFSPTEMSSIRLTLRQRHFIQDGDYQVFHVGIREIGITYNDYHTGSCRFEIPVEFNSAFTNKQILDITPIFQNDSALSVHQRNTRIAAFRVYEIANNGSQTYIGDTFPIQVKTNRILVKAVLNFDRNTKATPALTCVEVSYKGDS